MLNRLKVYLEMIKFSHTVFALPFAFMGAIIASNGIPPLKKIFLITLAMVFARSSAMGFNRLIDADIDKENPRTSIRAIPSGKLSKTQVGFFVVTSMLLFITTTYFINLQCFALSIPALLIVFFYSYTKRFTYVSHLVLGFALSVAPVGATIAITGEITFISLILCVAVIFWVAGFDILYALQDREFDVSFGLHSFPEKFGIKKSLIIARISHTLMLVFLISLAYFAKLGGFYLVGVFIITCMLLYEHSLVREDDLSKLDIAFFNINGYISMVIFVFTVLDIIKV